MDTREIIIDYYSSIKPLPEMGDIVTSACWLRPTFKHNTNDNLTKAVRKYARKRVLDYTKEMEDCARIADADFGSLYASMGCVYENVYMDMVPVPSSVWRVMFPGRGKDLPEPCDYWNSIVAVANLKAEIALKSAQQEFYLILMNENSQALRVIHCKVNEGSPAPSGFAKQRLHWFDTKEVGAKICMFCDVKGECKEKFPNKKLLRRDDAWNTPLTWDLCLERSKHIEGEMDKYLNGLNKRPSKSHNDGRLHPSELCRSKCLRRLSYSLRMEEKVETFSPYLRRIFDMGHSVHDALQDAMVASKIPIEKRVERNDILLRGSADGVTDTHIVEIKSASGNSHQKRQESGKPQKEHVYQASIYAAVLDRKRIEFLYYNKDTAEILRQDVPMDNDLWLETVKKAKEILEYHNKGELAPRLEGKTRCKECPYKAKCEPLILNK
tara:strand:- start:2817 stop:4133 length:1317 start_codon:yes stop_codon:yes gene_type:complete